MRRAGPMRNPNTKRADEDKNPDWLAKYNDITATKILIVNLIRKWVMLLVIRQLKQRTKLAEAELSKLNSALTAPLDDIIKSNKRKRKS